MVARVQTEITAYQLCVLDESLVESPHAAVSRITSSSRSSKPWTWFSRMRFRQNKALRSYMNHVRTGEFERRFRKWKCMGQRSVKTFLKGRPVRKKNKTFFSFIYRLSAHNREELPVFANRDTLDQAAEHVPVEDADRAALKKDFLLRVFRPNTYLSLPAASDIRKLSGLVDGPEVTAPPDPRIMQIINTDFSSKKHVPTEYMRMVRRQACPALVQRVDAWGLREYPGNSMNVFTIGDVEIMDLLKLDSWDTIIGQCVIWTQLDESDISGCSCISHPEYLKDRVWRSLKYKPFL